MTLEKSLFSGIKAALEALPALSGVPVLASWDTDELGSRQVVVDVANAIAAAPGTSFPYFKLPVEIVILSDRHDDPEKTTLQQVYQAVFGLLTGPLAVAADGMVIRACIPDASQDGPDSDENFNVLNYKSTFYVEQQ